MDEGGARVARFVRLRNGLAHPIDADSPYRRQSADLGSLQSSHAGSLPKLAVEGYEVLRVIR
jgi:hypothetical protein